MFSLFKKQSPKQPDQNELAYAWLIYKWGTQYQTYLRNYSARDLIELLQSDEYPGELLQVDPPDGFRFVLGPGPLSNFVCFWSVKHPPFVLGGGKFGNDQFDGFSLNNFDKSDENSMYTQVTDSRFSKAAPESYALQEALTKLGVMTYEQYFGR